uniref:Uncharacterized protein n=1 Tax=Spironucleus salmonicida TaxID=348837 RepID=V6LQ28_9EUKA|eukprot:EST46777.1 Hypothetical protein SS50377_13204 [Spironucleus salmonicida]
MHISGTLAIRQFIPLYAIQVFESSLVTNPGMQRAQSLPQIGLQIAQFSTLLQDPHDVWYRSGRKPGMHLRQTGVSGCSIRQLVIIQEWKSFRLMNVVPYPTGEGDWEVTLDVLRRGYIVRICGDGFGKI